MTNEVTWDDLATPTDARIAVPSSDAFDSTYLSGTGQGYDGVVRVSGTTGSGTVFGTGSLLSSGTHVLTAAHVVDDIISGSGEVRFETSSGIQTVTVTSITIHPEYVAPTLENDIAILTLSGPAPGDAERYDIFRGDNEVGQTHVRVGYGRAGTGESGTVLSDPGLGSTRRIGNNEYDSVGDVLADRFGFSIVPGTTLAFDFDDGTMDADAFGVYFGIFDTGLGGAEVNSTSGDSGGPVFINGQVAGITSYGFSPFLSDVTWVTDSSFGEISGDTRVSAFADWIDGIVGTASTSPPATTTDGGSVLTSLADSFTGSSGNDIVTAGSGSDTISGSDGNDLVYGNKEVDFLYGGAGDDTLYGGQNDGPETSNGGVFAQRQGFEFVFGGDGNDLLYGNHGAEQMFGEAGADILFGGQESDTLSGGDGADSLFGNRDDDFLHGGGGDDSIDGGDGTDTAVYSFTSSNYVVSNFGSVIVVSGLEGTDVLSNIEVLSFADGVRFLSSSLPVGSMSTGRSVMLARDHEGLDDDLLSTITARDDDGPTACGPEEGSAIWLPPDDTEDAGLSPYDLWG